MARKPGKIGCENGFVRLANEWFDEFLRVRLSASEITVFLAVARYTYGFNKLYSIIPFEKATGLNVRTIERAIKALVDCNIVICYDPPSGPKPGKYGPNKHYSEWATPTKMSCLPRRKCRATPTKMSDKNAATPSGTKARSTPKDNYKDSLLKTPPPTPQGASVVVEISPGGENSSIKFAELMAGSIIKRIEDAFGPVAPRYRARITEASYPPAQNPKTWARLLKERFFAHVDYTKSAWSANPDSVKSPIGILVARLIADSALLKKG